MLDKCLLYRIRQRQTEIRWKTFVLLDISVLWRILMYNVHKDNWICRMLILNFFFFLFKVWSLNLLDVLWLFCVNSILCGKFWRGMNGFLYLLCGYWILRYNLSLELRMIVWQLKKLTSNFKAEYGHENRRPYCLFSKLNKICSRGHTRLKK